MRRSISSKSRQAVGTAFLYYYNATRKQRQKPQAPFKARLNIILKGLLRERGFQTWYRWSGKFPLPSGLPLPMPPTPFCPFHHYFGRTDLFRRLFENPSALSFLAVENSRKTFPLSSPHHPPLTLFPSTVTFQSWSDFASFIFYP